MQIEAIYNKGQLILPADFYLCSEVFKIRVEIPEEVIYKPQETSKGVNTNSYKFSIRQQLDEILGCKRDGNASQHYTAQDYKHIWHKHLEEKYLEPK